MGISQIMALHQVVLIAGSTALLETASDDEF